MNQILIDRVNQRLEEIGRSAEDVSGKATGNVDAIRRIRRGHEPMSKNLEKIAAELGVSSAWLLGRDGAVGPDGKRDFPFGAPAEALAPIETADARTGYRPGPQPRDLPYYGTALAHDLSIGADGHMVEVEQHILDLVDAIEWRVRPPRLSGRRDAYGAFVQGTSMQPRYDPGDPVAVDPRAPLHIGDDVIVQLYADDEEDAGDQPRVAMALIKQLVKRSASWVELRQFEPAMTFRIEMRRIAAIHRIVPRRELDLF